MSLVNLTPHAINIVSPEGEAIRTIEPEAAPARVSASTETAGEVDGVPVVHQTLGEVEGLPEPAEGTAYVVSRMVATAATDRDDLLVPASLVRDASGRIVGCAALEVV